MCRFPATLLTYACPCILQALSGSVAGFSLRTHTHTLMKNSNHEFLTVADLFVCLHVCSWPWRQSSGTTLEQRFVQDFLQSVFLLQPALNDSQRPDRGKQTRQTHLSASGTQTAGGGKAEGPDIRETPPTFQQRDCKFLCGCKGSHVSVPCRLMLVSEIIL